jgi:radical SAM-linked protein
MHYRPVRWRSAESVVRLAREGIRRTGWEEVSLLSLSATDYPFLGEVVDRLNAAFYEKRVAVSLPSLRAEGFSEELAGALKKVRKAGLTFAPEAGTDRLRRVINKPLNEEELLRTIRTVYGNGWGLVKLYFMVGLPTEREEDLKGIAGLADRIGRIAGGKGVKLNVSPFVPKPHTPFQWDGQDSLDSLEDKLSLVRGLVRRKNVRVKSHDPRASKIEAILARGDRRLSGAVERAWRLGCRFDEWSEHFRFDLWKQALQEEGFGLEEYAGPRDLEAALPWDHIDLGILPGFLKEEWRRARSGELTRGCPAEVCESCGVCPSPGISPAAAEAVGGTAPASWREGVDEDFGRRKRRLLNTPSLVRTRFRVQYRKGPEVRFLSHLDLMRALTRAFRRADLPLAFSEGFSPHPRVAFGPPLTLGFVSRAEFLDLQLSRPPEGPLPGIVNPVLPAGLWILESRPILRKTDSLSSVVNTAAYECLVPGPSLSGSINSFLSRGEVRIVRKQGDRQREVDIRPLVLSLRELAGGGGIEMLLRAGGAEGVNPREVLREVTGLPEEGILGLLIERVGLFVERQGKLVSPMELI